MDGRSDVPDNIMVFTKGNDDSSPSPEIHSINLEEMLVRKEAKDWSGTTGIERNSVVRATASSSSISDLILAKTSTA